MTRLTQGYLATVTDLYHTARYEQGRALALDRWPGVAWIEPARMGWSLEAWRAAWATVLPTLDLLAVIPREDLSIGRGCWREITDCQRHGVPVYCLSGARWSAAFDLIRLPGGRFTHWAKVRVCHER